MESGIKYVEGYMSGGNWVGGEIFECCENVRVKNWMILSLFRRSSA